MQGYPTPDVAVVNRALYDDIKCPLESVSAMLRYLCASMPSLKSLGVHGLQHDVYRRYELLQVLIDALFYVEVIFIVFQLSTFYYSFQCRLIPTYCNDVSAVALLTECVRDWIAYDVIQVKVRISLPVSL